MLNKYNNSNILNKIAPFNNGIFYRDCVITNLLAIITSYGLNPTPLLLNWIDIYHYDNKKNGLYIIPYNKSYIKTLNQIGVKEISIKSSNDVIRDLIQSIDMNMPAIISIDAFYDFFIPFTFNKIHDHHVLLVYGYNNKTSTFNILDFYNNKGYAKRIMTYKDLIYSYEKYLINFSDDPECTFYQYSIGTSKIINTSNVITSYFKKYLEVQEHIMASFNNILYFVENLESLIENKNDFKKKIKHILNSLFWISINRNSEIYKDTEILGLNNELIDILKKINWNITLNLTILTKCIDKSVHNKKDLNTCFNKFIDIYELEKKYHEKFLQYCIKNTIDD